MAKAEPPMQHFKKKYTTFATCATKIFNKYFESGTLPRSKKLACIRLLLKNGKVSQAYTSFRPLYNMSFLSEILERAALNRLSVHIEQYKVLLEVQ